MRGFIYILLVGLALVGMTQPIDYIAYYPFTGDNTQDFSRNSNDGTLQGNASTVPGRLGPDNTALSLDGIADWVQTDLQLSGLSSFSFSVWAYWNEGSNSEYSILGFKTGPETSGTYFGLAATNVLRVGDVDTDFIIPNQEWVHYTVTYDGTNFVLYINGDQTFNDTRSIQLVELTIGAISTNGAGSWDGLIDDVRIYDRVLSGVEIASIYQEQNLVAFYPFNTTAEDASGNGNNAFFHRLSHYLKYATFEFRKFI